MSDLTVSAKVRLAKSSPFRLQKQAGEDLTAGSAVKAGDTGVYVNAAIKAVSVGQGTGVTGIGGQFDGMVIGAVKAGEPVTIFQEGTVIHLVDSGLTIGSFYYLSATGGLISTLAICTGEMPVLKAISATDVIVVRMATPTLLVAAS